jgi:transcriptional regulator with XRE-family HTH domain
MEMPNGRESHADSDARTMGARIKELRLEQGMSLDALASYCGVSKAAIHLWEAGQENIGLQAFLKLLAALDTNFEYLVFGTLPASRANPRVPR